MSEKIFPSKAHFLPNFSSKWLDRGHIVKQICGIFCAQLSTHPEVICECAECDELRHESCECIFSLYVLRAS